MKEFTNLHCHTEFSLLDGLGKTQDVIARAKEIGQKSIAITDHGTCGGHANFNKYANDEKVKSILGCELYVVEDYLRKGLTEEEKKELVDKYGEKEYAKRQKEKEKELKIRKSDHLIILAKNEEGLVNLYKILSEANINGFYYRPRTSYKFISENKNGLVVLSACLAGRIPQLIMENDLETAESFVFRFKELFGDDYYLEIQPNGLPQQISVNKQLVKLAKKCNVKCVATNDNHYIYKDDKKAHDTLLLLKQKFTWEDVEKLKNKESGDEEEGQARDKVLLFSVKDLYLKSYDEMFESFKEHRHEISDADIIAALDNTNEVAAKCIDKHDFKKKCFPGVKIPSKYDIEIQNKLKEYELEDNVTNRTLSYFRILINEGWQERIEGKIPEEKTQEYMDRLKLEFDVITSKGYTEYFLVVSEFIRWAKNQDILVGVARGSAAGCLISYLLRIIDIDPIPFGLYFERFLNPQRCLHPETYVITRYKSKKIIDIQIGDLVLTDCKQNNLESGSYKRVLNKVIRKIKEKVLKICYTDNECDYVICTKNHKWIIYRNNIKIESLAEDLLITDKLILGCWGEDDEIIGIDKIEEIDYEGEVVDIEVEDDHIFYVSHNNNSFILTHNSKPPDIDSDFPDDKRELVRQHIISEYGEERVAQVIAYNTMSINMCFRDVARVFGLPLEIVGEIAKQMVTKHDELKSYMTIDENLEMNGGALKKYFSDKVEERPYPDYADKIKEVFDIVRKLQHQVRHASISAAASVITEKEIYNYAPLKRTKDGIAIEFDGTMMSKMNMLKMDLLGIRCLKIIKETLDMLKAKGTIVDLYDLNLLKDEETIKLFRNGETLASFQFDSFSIREVLKKIKPTCFEDVIAAAALFRPGPLSAGIVDVFCQRKNGEYVETDEDRKNAKFLRLFDDILKDTYGVVVYQEQLIFLFNKVFGLDMGEADLLRRSIDERKKDEIQGYVDKIKKNINKSLIKDEKTLNEALDYIGKISGYSFNKCVHKDTLIHDLSNSNSQITIEQAFKDKITETYSMDENHSIIFNGIKNIYYTGIKELYNVTLESGKNIKTTLEHKFFTEEFKEIQLKDLKVRDIIISNRIGHYLCRDTIISIEYFGKDDTYDIEMEGPNHNYLANDILVHNSHSTGYAYVAFWTMYLKAHYPLEFGLMTINNRLDSHEIIRDFQQIWRNKCGIELTPIDINKSKHGCVYYPEEKKVYAGLLMLKGIGGAFANKLIAKQPFRTIEDLADAKIFSKVGFECLVKLGALDGLQQKDFGYVNRKELFHLLFCYQYKLDYKKLKNTTEYDDFFKLPRMKKGTFREVYEGVKAVQFEDYTAKEKIKFEKDYFEFLLFSSITQDIKHIKDKYEKYFNTKFIPFKELVEDSKYEKKIVRLLGTVDSVEEKTSKNNNIFYYVTLDDGNDKLKVLVWKQIFDDNIAKFKEGKRVLIIASRSTWKEKYVSFVIENKYEEHGIVLSMKQLENFILKNNI